MEPRLPLVRSNHNILLDGCCPSRRPLLCLSIYTEYRHTHTHTGGQHHKNKNKTKPKSNIVKHKASTGRNIPLISLFLFGPKVGVEDMGGRGEGHRRLFLWIFTSLDIQGGSGWILHTYMVYAWFYFSFSCRFLSFHLFFLSFCLVDGCPRYPCGSCRAGPQLFHHHYFFFLPTCSAGPLGLAAGSFSFIVVGRNVLTFY